MSGSPVPLLRDLVTVAVRPGRAYGEATLARSRLTAAVTVIAAGVVAAGISAAATLVETDAATDRAAGLGFSAVLPILFVTFWLIDATIVDAVAQLMAAPTRLRTWAVASAHAIPFLIAFELVRLVQAALDHAGALDAATVVGFAEFAVMGWFVWVLSCGVRAVYALPSFSAVSAALAPPAAMMAVLLVLVLIAVTLHVSGVG